MALWQCKPQPNTPKECCNHQTESKRQVFHFETLTKICRSVESQFKNRLLTQIRSTTFLWLWLSPSMYHCVVCKEECLTIIWISLKDPPTNEIFLDVSVMKVRRPLCDEHPISPMSSIPFLEHIDDGFACGERRSFSSHNKRREVVAEFRTSC